MANFAKVIFVHLYVCYSVQRGKNLGRNPHTQAPPWAGTTTGQVIPRQVHHPARYPPPPNGQVHTQSVLPPAKGRYGQVHPQAGIPPGSYTLKQVPPPLGRYTTWARACWEIWPQSGQYASYWNALSFQ